MAEDTHRLRRAATPEERQMLAASRPAVERDLPELRLEAQQIERERRLAAAREPTVSGQLRRAIFQSGQDHRELALQTEIDPRTLAEFLVGDAALDSAAIDKLAGLLRQELRPVT